MNFTSDSASFCIHRTFSSKWRAREAREVFGLLREEYSKSKRLSIFKRYKEIERIIRMFTSEQVIQKLMYLTREKAEESEEEFRAIERKRSVCSYDRSGFYNDLILDDLTELDSVFDDTEQEDTAYVNNTFLEKVVSSIFVKFRNRSVPSPSSGSGSDTPACDSDLPTSLNAGLENLTEDGHRPLFYVGSSKYSTKSNSTSSISHCSPTCFTPTDSTNECFMLPTVSPIFSDTSPRLSNKNKQLGSTFSGISASVNNNVANSNKYNIKSSWSRLQNKQSTPTSSKPPSFRCKTRRGVEQYAIRSDQIPAFQIPPQRKPQGLHYLSASANKKVSDSTPSTPRIRRCSTAELKTNVSFPNLSPRLGQDYSTLAPLEFIEAPRRRTGHNSNYSPLPTRPVKERSKSDHLFLVSPKIHQEEDFFSTQYKRKLSYAECTDELDEIFISSSYEHLLQLKSDFENLPGKSMWSRYKSMKTMIKKCLELNFQMPCK